MARRNIRSWVAATTALGLLTSCLVPKYNEFQSDAGSAGNSGSGGVASVGGSSSVVGSTTVGGDATLGGASASGGANASGATSIGGASTSIGGASTSIGGTNGAGGTTGIGTTQTSGAGSSATGTSTVGGTRAAGGTGAIGGANTTGIASTVGGVSSAGGTGNAGGSANVGSTANTGGVSTSPTGGTSASTGVTTTTSGGTAVIAGGATSTGGANPTGGTAAAGGVTASGGTTSAPVPVQISAGYQHACALLSDNTVWCWGDNSTGELGISTATQSSPVPVRVQFAGTAASIKAVSAGRYHSCAVFSDGSAQCWGENDFSQLGNGATTNTSSPVAVMASASAQQTGIQSISAGGKFTCSVVSDSTYGSIVKCWGYGSDGELGTGCSSCNAKYPGTVLIDKAKGTPLSDVRAVSAGLSHACAVLNNGTTYRWGVNTHGQLGNGSTNDSNLPQQVYDDANAALVASDVSAGGFSSCALVSGSVRCWGYNYYGQLGNGASNVQELKAVHVTLTNDSSNPVVQLSNGYEDACAVLKTGDIYCWGDGASGQLGQDPSKAQPACYSIEGNYCSSSPILVKFPDISKPNVKVSCGNQFTMAWNDNGSAYGLGADYYYGQLGDGNTTDSYTPVPIYPSWK